MDVVGRTRIGPAAAGRPRVALGDRVVIARYRAKVDTVAGHSCWFWTGAVSGRGHGRFWLPSTGAGEDRRGVVVLAHRFGYGLVHGYDALVDTEEVAHGCDNPLCQFPGQWQDSTHAANRGEWAARRHELGGPLRDVRGARARAVAIRDAVRDGRALGDVLGVGVRAVDAGQLALWEHVGDQAGAVARTAAVPAR